MLFPYLEDEDERHPLVKRSVRSGGCQVVAVVDEVPRLPVPGLPLYHQLGVHHTANTALGRRGNCSHCHLSASQSYLVLRSDMEGGVDPTVVIQHRTGHSRAGLTIDGITEILK